MTVSENPPPAPETEAQPAEKPPEDERAKDIGERALRFLAYGMAGGALVPVLFAVGSGSVAEFFSVIGVCAMTGGASLLVGGTLGFLFGIPRTLQEPGAAGPEGGAGADEEGGKGKGTAPASRQYAVNTNLEQISDWLTKMLVGVGLTQLYKLPGLFDRLGGLIAPGLGEGPGAKTFGIAVSIYFMVTGFLFGYLWARLFLLGAFRQADVLALGAEARKTREGLRKAEARLTEMESRERRDARALSLATRQLNPSPDLPPVEADKLEAAILDASGMARAQIFNEAWKVRSETWREEASKDRMERTIPIFRALIKGDRENRYHMNHGQLGFALKDSRVPDWEGAREALAKAIEIRGPWYESGRWLFYEFNQALAEIELDPAFKAEKPSDPETKKRIFDDLVGAWSAPDIHPLFSEEPVKSWMRINKVTRPQLEREADRLVARIDRRD